MKPSVVAFVILPIKSQPQFTVLASCLYRLAEKIERNKGPN
jgi:hypothetical protein